MATKLNCANPRGQNYPMSNAYNGYTLYKQLDDVDPENAPKLCVQMNGELYYTTYAEADGGDKVIRISTSKDPEKAIALSKIKENIEKNSTSLYHKEAWPILFKIESYDDYIIFAAFDYEYFEGPKGYEELNKKAYKRLTHIYGYFSIENHLRELMKFYKKNTEMAREEEKKTRDRMFELEAELTSYDAEHKNAMNFWYAKKIVEYRRKLLRAGVANYIQGYENVDYLTVTPRKLAMLAEMEAVKEAEKLIKENKDIDHPVSREDIEAIVYQCAHEKHTEFRSHAFSSLDDTRRKERHIKEEVAKLEKRKEYLEAKITELEGKLNENQ